MAAPGGAVPLTWVAERDRGRLVHYCERCARENLRALEAKLDRDYW